MLPLYRLHSGGMAAALQRLVAPYPARRAPLAW